MKTQNIVINQQIIDYINSAKYLDDSGEARWYEIQGETYGIADDGSIMDYEGCDIDSPEKWELKEALAYVDGDYLAKQGEAK